MEGVKAAAVAAAAAKMKESRGAEALLPNEGESTAVMVAGMVPQMMVARGELSLGVHEVDVGHASPVAIRRCSKWGSLLNSPRALSSLLGA